MDYRTKIVELVYRINSKKLLRFLYYFIEDAIERYDALFGEGPCE